MRRSRPDHEKRVFVKPIVNFEAKSYWELCSFPNCDLEYITEPRITFGFTPKELQSCLSGQDLILPAIPIHSVNNERAVAETTKACKAYKTYEERIKNIFMTLKSRAELPTHAKKSDYG